MVGKAIGQRSAGPSVRDEWSISRLKSPESFTLTMRWAGLSPRIFGETKERSMSTFIRKYSGGLFTFGVYAFLVLLALLVSLGVV